MQLLLFFSRLDFGVGVGATFSLAFFIFFFDTRTSPIWSNKVLGIVVAYLTVLMFYIFTDLIISGLSYSAIENVYREVPGKLYPIHTMLHMAAALLFCWFSVLQLKKQTYLNRIRLKRILLSAFILLISCLLLQLILPLFGIWILEKEIVFFFALFMLYIFLTVKRYYFSSLGYGIGKIVIAFVSIVFSIAALNLIHLVLLRMKTGIINNYWIFQDQFSIIDTIVGVIIFYISYKYLHKIFLGNTRIIELESKIQKLEQNISYINNLKDLDVFLGNEIKKIFKTKYCGLNIFPKDGEQKELQRYFENDLSDKIFINDVVFIEEKKTKFDRELLFQEMPEEAFLVLPLFNNQDKNIAVFIMGAKSFGDFYTIEEINILRRLMSILEMHLKYIETYEQIQDLSVNLDKKVDEKTIEYNDLINKQKEFISTISHEIKTPITTALFQADSIMDDLEKETIPREDIKKELMGLSSELIKTGELLSRIFSVQYFDTHNVTLFRERVQISYLLETEYDVYSRMHEHIRFINRIDAKMGFVEIDRIQFQQVITNLLNNAIKFAAEEDPIIILTAHRSDEWLHISIEDNGKGFEGIDIERLFEKYSVGSSGSAGLGMGLYLCKKIIDMHRGDIIASVSDELGGAKFIIKIPVH